MNRLFLANPIALLVLWVGFALSANAQIQIMPLGDSITQGFADSGSGYRDQLYTDLTGAGIAFKFTGATTAKASSTLTNAGQHYHNGYSIYTIQNLRDNLDGAVQPNPGADNAGGYWMTGGNGTGRAAAQPDIVLLEAGTNDIDQGIALATVQSRMAGVLNWFTANRPKTHVIVSLVTPYNDAQTGTTGKNALVQQFNAWLVQTVPTYGGHFSLVDNYSLFIDANGAIKTSTSADGIYLSDGIHPSHAGYQAMGANWFQAIRPVLAQLDYVGADIGGVGLAGSAGASSGTSTLQGAGAGIAGTSDAFYYDFKTATGDCSIIARVASVTNTTSAAQAGVMIRDTATPGAKQVSLLITPGGGVQFVSRSTAGGTASVGTTAGLAAPCWVRVVRSGNTLTASTSPDGSTWTTRGTTTLVLSHQVQVGLVAASGGTTQLCTAVFDNVSTPLSLRRIMPLGDSITKGATDSGSGYRDRVYGNLTAAGLAFSFIGQTTANASAQLTAAGQHYHNGYGTFTALDIYNNLTGSSQPAGADNNMGGYWMTSGVSGGTAVNPDIVLLHAGTNDIYRGYSLAVMKSNMAQVMSWFRVNRPYAQVIVAKIVPRLDSTARNQQTLDFNAWLDTVVPTCGANFSLVDMYALFIESDGTIKTSGSADGIYLNDTVHPNHAGYVAMAGVWFNGILGDLFPGTPYGLTATPGDAQVALAWSPVAGVTGYNVKRATTSGGPYTTIASNLASPSFTDATASNFTTYYYVVSSIVPPVGESTNSIQASATPFSFPPAPAGLTATAGTGVIQLSWSAATSATSYNIKRAATNGGAYTTIASAYTGTSFSDSSAALTANTPYYYVVTAVNSLGQSPVSNQATATITASNPALPGPWLAKNIGTVTVAGTASVSSGTFTVTGGGAAINAQADSFYYVYQQVSGDCSITARVVSQQNTHQFAQCGVMLRQSLDANSAHVMASMTPQHGIGYYQRSSTAATLAYSYPNLFAPPYWVRIVRAGNVLTTSQSANGSTWTTLGTATLNLGTWVYVGLPVDSVSNTTTSQVVFDNVTVTSIGQPAVPANLSATASDTSITLNWNTVGGATSYEVKRSSAHAGPYTIIAGGLSSATYADTTASTGTTYYYVVSALNSGGESGDSAEASALRLTAYQQWKLDYGLPLDLPASATPDNDGVPVLLKYATGMAPGVSAPAGAAVLSGTSPSLTLQFNRLAPAPVTYLVEASSDLTAWTTLATLTAGADTWSGTASVSEGGAGSLRTTTVADTVAMTSSSRRFLRLRVTAPAGF